MPTLANGSGCDHYDACPRRNRTTYAATSTSMMQISLSFIPNLPLTFSSRRLPILTDNQRFASARRSNSKPVVCKISMAAARRQSKPIQPDNYSEEKPELSESVDLLTDNGPTNMKPPITEEELNKSSEKDADPDPTILDDEEYFMEDYEQPTNQEDSSNIPDQAEEELAEDLFSNPLDFYQSSIDEDEEDDDADDNEDDDDSDDDIEALDAAEDDVEDDIDGIEAEGDVDFEQSVDSMTSLRSKKDFTPSSGRAGIADEPDENDDVIEDVDELISSISDQIGDGGIEEVDDSEVLDDETKVVESSGDATDIPIDEGDFDDDADDDIQSAAEILKERGLLGLGIEKDLRDDGDSVKEFALAVENDDEESDSKIDDGGLNMEDEQDDGVVEKETEFDMSTPPVTVRPSRSRAVGVAKNSRRTGNLSNLLDEGTEDLGINNTDEIDGEEDGDGEENGQLDYPDIEDDDEDGLGLTSHSEIGTVWDLNEDTYVTITKAGESYGYELDMEDQQDQDMATVRRGKQGGWSGGVASYPASDLPEGSKEWVARRSYELMTKASYKGMLRWAKWHEDPPPEIAELYPADPPAATPLGVSILNKSAPPAKVTLIARSGNSNNYDDVDDNDDLFNVSEEYEDVELDAVKDIENADLQMWGGQDNGVQEGGRKRSSAKDDDKSVSGSSVEFPCTYQFKIDCGVGEEVVSSLRETVLG